MKQMLQTGEQPQLIGYARVSTEEQNPDLQLDALKKVGCLNIYVEQVSGAAKARKRPELRKALDDLRPGDTLIVWRLDRLARNVQQLYEYLGIIHEAGATLRSLTEGFDLTTAGGKFLLGVLGLVAEFERQLTIERTLAGIKARQERGLAHGAPVRFRNEHKEKARKMLLSGMSYPEVGKKLKFSPSTISKWWQKQNHKP